MATKVSDLLRPVEEHLGAGFMMWPDGGFVSGAPEDEVEGVLVTWMMTRAALEQAAAAGCNLIICHEWPFFSEKDELPPYRFPYPLVGDKEPAWHPNTRRRALLEKYGYTVVQMHYALDRFCLYDAFAEAMHLENVVAGEGWYKVYALAQPMTLRELALEVKCLAEIEGTIRVAGDLDRRLERVAHLWGGAGMLSNAYCLRRVIENGAQAAICGEIEEMGCHFALETGFSLIETSHVLSEMIGMRRFAEILQTRFPALEVHLHEMPRPYTTL
jgi:putative NIF3 family GTP cyclohydrolase 1 type 2